MRLLWCQCNKLLRSIDCNRTLASEQSHTRRPYCMAHAYSRSRAMPAYDLYTDESVQFTLTTLCICVRCMFCFSFIWLPTLWLFRWNVSAAYFYRAHTINLRNWIVYACFSLHQFWAHRTHLRIQTLICMMYKVIDANRMNHIRKYISSISISCWYSPNKRFHFLIHTSLSNCTKSLIFNKEYFWDVFFPQPWQCD